jgi:RecA-family ATPase
LAEIAPNIIHPVLRKDIKQILDGLTNKSKVTKYGTLDIKLPRGENVFNIG